MRVRGNGDGAIFEYDSSVMLVLNCKSVPQENYMRTFDTCPFFP